MPTYDKAAFDAAVAELKVRPKVQRDGIRTHAMAIMSLLLSEMMDDLQMTEGDQLRWLLNEANRLARSVK